MRASFHSWLVSEFGAKTDQMPSRKFAVLVQIHISFTQTQCPLSTQCPPLALNRLAATSDMSPLMEG
jgi:hypothetical protein